MKIIILIYLTILALTLGSFYNVVGLRVPLGQSIVRPRSHCTSCQTTLRMRDLIPVFSYLAAKGKCRYCGARVSSIYPIFELLTAVGFVVMYVKFGLTGEFLIGALLVSLLIIVTVCDIHYMIIPNKILLFFLPIIVVCRLFFPIESWYDQFIGGAAGFLLLFLLAVISRGGMGGGDIKLFGLIGMFLGAKLVLLAFFLSTLFGTIYGAFLYVKGSYEKGKPIPFSPFIALGTITAYLFGNDIIEWYLLKLL